MPAGPSGVQESVGCIFVQLFGLLCTQWMILIMIIFLPAIQETQTFPMLHKAPLLAIQMAQHLLPGFLGALESIFYWLVFNT